MVEIKSVYIVDGFLISISCHPDTFVQNVQAVCHAGLQRSVPDIGLFQAGKNQAYIGGGLHQLFHARSFFVLIRNSLAI